MSGANKWDDKKESRPGLIAPEFLDGVGKVLGFGAKKYSPGNWSLGMNWSRSIDAHDRHMNSWKGGENNDPETGLSHLFHAACNLMFLSVFQARNIGTDDRQETGLQAKDKE